MKEALLTVLSFSAGQDSVALLLMLIHDKAFRKTYAPGDLIVVMADTGNEHPHTYSYIPIAQKWCKENGIPFFLLKPTPENVTSAWVGGLTSFLRRYRVIISKATRNKSCTDQLKIQPIYRFLARYVNEKYLHGMFRAEGKQSLKAFASQYGKINVLIGFTKEEAARRIGKYQERGWMKLAIQKVYPLVILGMSRVDCQHKIRSYGMPVPNPSNCMFCPFASKREILWLHRNFPLSFQEWIQYEKNKLEKFEQKQREAGKKNHGVWGQGKTLPQILEEAEKEFGHLSDEELNEYKFSHGHCVTTSY